MRSLVLPTGIASLRREMDRLFDRVWDFDAPEFPVLGEWTPAVDVSETMDAITVKAEVPGIDPKDIKITLHNQLLTIKGEKFKETEEKDEQFYRMERLYGSFMRSLRLPVPVDTKKVNATFKNGLLTVQLSKIQVGDGGTIPIKAE